MQDILPNPPVGISTVHAPPLGGGGQPLHPHPLPLGEDPSLEVALQELPSDAPASEFRVALTNGKMKKIIQIIINDNKIIEIHILVTDMNTFLWYKPLQELTSDAPASELRVALGKGKIIL